MNHFLNFLMFLFICCSTKTSTSLEQSNFFKSWKISVIEAIDNNEFLEDFQKKNLHSQVDDITNEDFRRLITEKSPFSEGVIWYLLIYQSEGEEYRASLSYFLKDKDTFYSAYLDCLKPELPVKKVELNQDQISELLDPLSLDDESLKDTIVVLTRISSDGFLNFKLGTTEFQL